MKHGMRYSSIYGCWANLIQRCSNPKNPKYKYYGARGIKVCARWHFFENFYADMGDKPEGLTLERKNNDGDYEPGNCKWATHKEQANNTRRQRVFIACSLKTGERIKSKNQCKFALQYGLNRGNISSCLCGRLRKHKGWTFKYLD